MMLEYVHMRRVNSPNTVIAKYMSDTIDILQPKIELRKPKEIIFYIGTNINGVPHFATAMVHCVGFMFAKKIKTKFGIPTKIKIGIHDNVSYDSKEDDKNVVFHKTYFHSLGNDQIKKLIKDYYEEYLNELSEKMDVEYEIETYSDLQKQLKFRDTFLKTLSKKTAIGWCVAPSTGILQVRVPCPVCQFSDRDSKRTKYSFNPGKLTVESFCIEHGHYESNIEVDNDVYIDLTTLYRNFIKEAMTLEDPENMYVMVKGGDWIYSTSTIDLVFGSLGFSALDFPSRVFTPQIVTSTGAKLSKSLISTGDKRMKNIPNWLLDLDEFKKYFGKKYLDKIIEFTEELFRDPRNMYRTYTVQEIIDLFYD